MGILCLCVFVIRKARARAQRLADMNKSLEYSIGMLD